MNSSTKYHIIEPSGTVLTAVWKGKLEDGTIPRVLMQEMLGIRELEHVSVIWPGALAHMWVDELGLMHGREVNPKATRVYLNASFRRVGLHEFLYEDLAANPAFHMRHMEQYAKARIIVGSTKMILGKALLWEGELS